MGRNIAQKLQNMMTPSHRLPHRNAVLENQISETLDLDHKTGSIYGRHVGCIRARTEALNAEIRSE